MPTIYENMGHRRSSMKNYHRLVFRLAEWRKDPRCRNPFCGKVTHNLQFTENWKDKVTLDHTVARCLGGADSEENFQILCGNCNFKKSKWENEQKSILDKKKP